MASSYTEEDINNALLDIENGLSIRRASTRWGIPRMTLFHRKHGTQPRNLAYQPRQKLSKIQEDHLV